MLGNLTYEYDKAGNRTKTGGSWARTAIPQNVASTSYDANNSQLTFGDKTLIYDDNGNLASITDANGTTLYSWNARNQLAAISGPNVNASFVYDGVGRREKKTAGGTITEFLYDGVNPVQETSGATVLANILTGLGIDEFFTERMWALTLPAISSPMLWAAPLLWPIPPARFRQKTPMNRSAKPQQPEPQIPIRSNTPAEKTTAPASTTTALGTIIRNFKDFSARIPLGLLGET